jgi:hypothetical protein
MAGIGARKPESWSEPQLSGQFQTAIGSSIVEQIVSGHTPADVLRELVQNEFDAHGREIIVAFGPDHLNVTGSGKPVDRAGWQRLSVILGTGIVIGANADGREVYPKENGIGSKNLGLRTVFLFGDRIYLRSAGKMAVLDLKTAGTLMTSDPPSRGRQGVSIDVPYRKNRFEKLEPFTVEREQAALDVMAAEMPYTLIKLALPRGQRSLNNLIVTADRPKRRIHWRQEAKIFRCRTKGVRGTRRHVRLIDTADDRSASTVRLMEIEFQRRVPIPEEYSGMKFANYFRSPQAHCRVGISIPVKRDRVDFSQLGRFYYPLASRAATTGSIVSVNAPFEMDGERQSPIDSLWNKWLIEQAVALTMDVLRDDLLQLFGADAYLALRPQGQARPDWFAASLTKALRGTDCWLSRASTKDKRDYRRANDVVVPEDPKLDGFLSEERYLDRPFAAAPDVRKMAQDSRARPFTVNSLVRLRCAGEDCHSLKTKVSDQANYFYRNYEAALRQPDRQIKMAATLTDVSRRLSSQNRDDLKYSRSTLAADGSLRRAADLFAVDTSIEQASLAQPWERLDPRLLGTVIAKLAKPFSIHHWVLQVSSRIKDGTADEDERESFYRYILGQGATLSARTFALLRRVPVIRDHRGDWVQPSELVSRRTPGFATLEPILSAPAPELEAQKALLARFAPARAIRSEHLIAFAKYVADYPKHAEAFETVLMRSRKLLTPRLVAQLHEISFLLSATGELAAPKDLHLRTPENLTCLDAEDGLVPDRNSQLYRALKCIEAPSSARLLTVIARRRDEGKPPRRPELFYQALVAALQRERVARGSHSASEILWVNRAYHAPNEVLVGNTIPRWFSNMLPVVRAPETLVSVYSILGAHAAPTDAHWRQFFIEFSDRYGDKVLSRTSEEWRSLVLAYRSRGPSGVPEGTSSAARFLLGRSGTLHNLADLRDGRFLEDDFPELSEAAQIDGADLAFAEVTDSTRDFLLALRLQRLSVICEPRPPQIVGDRPPPLWFRDDHRARLIERLRHPLFAKALVALGRVEARPGISIKLSLESGVKSRLDRIETIVFAQDIRRTYEVRDAEITISVEEAVAGNQFVVVGATSLNDLNNLLAYALAELLGAVRIDGKRALSLAILPLLQCRNTDEMMTFLRRQGIAGWYFTPSESEEEPTFSGEPVDTADVVEGVVRQITVGLEIGGGSGSDAGSILINQPTLVVTSENGAVSTDADEPLPPIEDVELTVTAFDASWSPPQPNAQTGGRTRAWQPRSTRQAERDREVGRRGEEVVYRYELDRLRRAGCVRPEDVVIWTSDHDPGADHDIRSIAEDGKSLWIEVKSTTGQDGFFEWPKNEFQKALREGDHYELWRVYEATSERPTAKRFPDPVHLVREGKLRVDLGTLRAVIQPMGAGAETSTDGNPPPITRDTKTGPMASTPSSQYPRTSLLPLRRRHLADPSDT